MNGFVNAGIFFLVGSAVLLCGIFIFNIFSKQMIWAEIGKGNVAMSMALGGIVLGVANILRCAIHANSQILMTLLWGGLGTLTLVLVFFIFQWITPKLDTVAEIGNDNRAVGFISFIFSLAFGLIIGACIS